MIAVVDSNLHRERILPSEKAFAYKMKMEAMKAQGKQTDLTLSQAATKSDTAAEIGKARNESRDQVFRYIRLRKWWLLITVYPVLRSTLKTAIAYPLLWICYAVERGFEGKRYLSFASLFSRSENRINQGSFCPYCVT